MNLKIKKFNREKAGFREIHTENDADVHFVVPHNNDATEFLMYQ